ncbi:MAG: hypothetical protein HQ515_21630 [Phycisphaeraceae bacterium]|nr:hypothetical protein [Phycisphaeraceae bacterium]
MSNEMIVIVAAAISAFVSSTACFVTYYYTKKRTLSEIQSKQSGAEVIATPKQKEIVSQKRLESYLVFWAKTSPLSSEYLRRMTPDEAKSLYDLLLQCYEQDGFYFTTKTGAAFQELRRVLRMLSRDEGKKDILEQIWKAKNAFRWSMKEDLMIVNEPISPLEMGWLETHNAVD